MTVAFLVAGAALERGSEVAMFLTKDAVHLAVPGHAEGVACDGCPPLERLFQQFADGGGELLVCPICVNARKLDADTFVANAAWPGPRRCWNGSATRRDGLQLLTLGHPRRVAVVEHQRVAVGVGEERHVADAGVEDVAVEVTPRSSSVARAAATSSTCSATWLRLAVNSPMPICSGLIDAEREVPVSNSAKLRSGR